MSCFVSDFVQLLGFDQVFYTDLDFGQIGFFKFFWGFGRVFGFFVAWFRFIRYGRFFIGLSFYLFFRYILWLWLLIWVQRIDFSWGLLVGGLVQFQFFYGDLAIWWGSDEICRCGCVFGFLEKLVCWRRVDETAVNICGGESNLLIGSCVCFSEFCGFCRGWEKFSERFFRGR